MQLYILEVIRLLTVFILFFAAWGKSQAFTVFQTNLVESFRVPVRFSKVATVAIIGTELLLAVGVLLNNQNGHLFMWLAFVMFGVFTLALMVSFSQNQLVKCNCFGAENRPVSKLDILRNLLLLALLLHYLLHPQSLLVAKEAQALCALVALLLCTMLVNFHDIASSFNKNKSWV